MKHISLARSPEEPQFAMGLLKLVMELRKTPSPRLDEAITRALFGMRVDRDAFRSYVHAHPERYALAASGGAPSARIARFR